MAFYVCSLRNEKSAGRIPQLITDDPAAVEAFSKKWDVPGRGVFECIGYLKSGATRRCRETVGIIWRLPVDIDFKDWIETAAEIDRKLQSLPLPLSWARNSGGGRHLEYILKEPAEADDEEYFERACQALKQLAARLSGDPLPTHPAALLRKPGTHNSKRGEPVLVAPLWGNGHAYDLTEVEALIERLPETGLLTPKLAGNGHDRTEGGPRLADEHKPPIDVAARLAAMKFEGPGDSSIHQTQLSVMASLLRSGVALEEATRIVLDATRAAVANDPKWNWRKEQLGILRMGCDFIVKKPELVSLLPDKWRTPFAAALAQGRRPDIGFNSGGFYLRSWRGASDTEANTKRSKEKTEEPKSGDSPPHKYRFKLMSFCDLKPGLEPLYLVDELIPVAGLVDVWGKAKCYKSFWTLDVMLHVAMGWEYRDRYVRQGAVVYCAFEGAHGYKKRVEALRRHYSFPADATVPLYVMPGQANLIAEHTVLIADITAQLGNTRPAAVVLDTLNKSLFGSENKDVDMGAYVRAAEAIRDAFGCVVIIVHHCGYDDTRPRGHSSLPGAVDAQLAVTRIEEIVTVTVEMMRDGPEDTQVVSEAEVIEVGQDQNGKTLTSLVIVPSDAEAAAREHQGWPRGLAVFHTALKSALAANGETFQPEAGVLPVKAVEQNWVRDRFYANYAEGEEDSGRRTAKLRQAFNRALAEAQQRGVAKFVRTATGQACCGCQRERDTP
jgi:AAA domain